jgi:hypothetical protein
MFAYSCDGPCMRSFHAKEGTGADSYCTTLDYTEAEIEVSFEAICDFFSISIFITEMCFFFFQRMKIFLCENCKYKQHQCYICGVLEPSDGEAAKVWHCKDEE